VSRQAFSQTEATRFRTRWLITDNSLQFELDGLRRQLAAVQQLCQQQPGKLEALWPGVMDELRRSVDALHECAGARHDNGSPAPAKSEASTPAHSAQRRSAIIEASLGAVITTDYEGRVVEFNTAAEALFGYTCADAIGRELTNLIVPPRLRPPLRVALADFRATGESPWIAKQLEALALRSDGAEVPIEFAVTRIANEDPPLLAVYVHDLRERKAAEREVALYQKRLRSLTAELLLAEESERRRLAVDLHDGLSQTIALAKMKLVTLLRSTDATLHGSLTEIEQLIDQANQSARSVTFELSPPVLHDLGLEPAVQWLVEHIHARYGLDIVLEGDGQPKPADATTRVIVFRAIRELLINAAKHARAQRVHVRLERLDDDVTATVDDDGVGMDPETAAVQGSGLFGIRERLGHMGGSIDIDSSPGRGTSICLRAPLKSLGTSTRRVRA
jgi:PAS domain S-box-containing protein